MDCFMQPKDDELAAGCLTFPLASIVPTQAVDLSGPQNAMKQVTHDAGKRSAPNKVQHMLQLTTLAVIPWHLHI